MCQYLILIYLFGLSFAVNYKAENSFKLNSDFEVNANDLGDIAVRDDTLIRYLVERIENIERLAKKEHENNLNLKERVLQLEARDKLHEYQLAEIQKRCDRTHEHDTTINRNASKGNGNQTGFKHMMVSNESNYGKKRSTMKTKYILGSGGYRILTPVTEEPVAFFSTFQHHMVHTGVHQVISFEKVITNVGNGYNPHAGDFRAPVAGIYVFSVSLMTYHETTSGSYAIRMNGTVVSFMYLRGEIGSQTVVFELNKGDDVAVICLDAKNESIWGHG